MTALAPLPGLERAQPPFSLRLDGPVWGFDPSTKRISLARLEPTHDDEEPTALTWSTLSLSQANGLHRLGRAYADISAWLPRDGAPAAIYVEQPFAGKIEHVHPQSYFMVGVLLAALGNAYPLAQIETVTPAQWKAAALGKGHGFAKKPEIFAWAQQLGYSGAIEDEADAIGIATGGAVARCS